MTRYDLLAPLTIGASIMFLSSGCAPEAKAPSTSTPSANAPASDDTPKGLAKLSEADRAAAVKQDICPVTGAKLGSMGAPPKVTVDGKEVFLCCIGCEDKLREDPATHLAKLKSN